MEQIKAIQTRYKGYHFRSRLEARWAVFFDTLEIKWEYEPEGYDLSEYGWYLPDFWLPKLEYFIEIKGVASTEEEQKKCQSLSNLYDVFLFDTGLGVENEIGSYADTLTPSGSWFSKGKWKDHDMKFLKCKKCGSIDITFDGWVHYSNKCSCYNDKNRNKMGSFHPDILNAINKAKSARFEHGEFGPT